MHKIYEQCRLGRETVRDEMGAVARAGQNMPTFNREKESVGKGPCAAVV